MTLQELLIVGEQCEEMAEQIIIGERKLVGKSDRLRLAAEEVEKFKQFDQLLEKIKNCTAKQFWVDFHKALDVLNSLEKELQNKYVKNLHDAQTKLKDVEDEIAAIEDFDTIEQQTKEKSDELKVVQLQFVEKESAFNEFKKCIPSMQSTVKSMETEVKRHEDKLKDIQKTIENMRQSILNAARDNERNFHESILNVSKSIESSEVRLEELGGVFNDSSDKRDGINRRREEMIPELRASEAKIRKLNEDIRGFSQQGQDKAAIFNPKMPEILQKMKSKKFKKKVLGPAGMFIKIREGCSEYALAVEQAIGPHMSTFLVSCIEDQRELSDLLRSCGREAEFNIRIEVQQPKPRFCGSSINKINGGMSAIEAITVDDDDIFNFIADRCRLDHVLLSPSEDDVERNFVVLEQRSRRRVFRDKISHVILKDGATIRYRDGNKAYESFKGHYRRALVGDMAAAIEAFQEQLAYEQNRVTEIRREQLRIESDLDRANQEVKQVDNERQRITIQLRQDKRRKENLENELVSVQEAGRIDTSPLEEEERDLRSAIDDYKFKISNAKVELESSQKAAKEAQIEKNRAQTQVDQIKAALDVLNDRINKYLTQKQEIQKRVEKMRRTVDEAERGVRDTEVLVQDHQNKLTEKRLVAEDKTRKLLGSAWDGNDLELDRNDTFESLGKKIANYDRKLEEGKQSVGLGQRSREQAYKNLDNAREDYDSHNKSLSLLREQLEGLKKDVKSRKKKWKDTRERSAGDVAAKFDYYLNRKGSRYEKI
jgi:chromosome segregation ATPase